MENIQIVNLITTMFSTAVGAIIGGLVTLIVNRKFEITKIRINNINDMKNDVTPALQGYVRALKFTEEFLLANESYEKTAEQENVVSALEDALASLNTKVDTYEIELSNMLDFHDLILDKSFVLLEKLKNVNVIEDPKSHFIELTFDIHRLVDMVATFNEEVSEIKRNMLSGRIRNYWSKDIFSIEKSTRVNYHNKKQI